MNCVHKKDTINVNHSITYSNKHLINWKQIGLKRQDSSWKQKGLMRKSSRWKQTGLKRGSSKKQTGLN